VDIIKVDFIETNKAEQRLLVNKYRPYQIQLLAEKVETREEFLYAYELGYVYFQGYFFSKPVVISSHDVPVYAKTYYHILEEISKTEPNIDIIATEIEQDLSLSYKLLKLINSPAFRPKNKIKSIKQAIVLLGLNEIKRWIYVLSVQGMNKTNDSKMQEVVRMSLIRGKLCEQLASSIGENHTSSYMLTGMFSLIDTLLHRKLEDILIDLPLSDDIQRALLKRDNELGRVLTWTLQIEKAITVEGIPLSKKKIALFYNQACEWANYILDINEKPF
ncbi:EAL and HDOD domain-containing protein, partial [Metabacillus niabensis]